MKYFICTSLIVLLFNRCVSDTDVKKDINILEINFDKEYNELDISQFYNATFIPLELNPNSCIGSVDKVIVHKDNIYIMDLYQTKSVYKFNLKGRFITKVGRQGKGNGEYLSLKDFNIKDDLLYLSSQYDNKIYVYKLNGEFLRVIPLNGTVGTKFSILNNSSFVINTADGSNKSSAFYKFNGKLLGETSSSKDFLHWLNPLSFCYYNDTTYMYFAFNNVIYSANEQELVPVCELNFGKYNFPLERINSKKEFMSSVDNGNYYTMSYFSLSENYIFMKVFDSKQYFTLVIDNKSKEIHKGNNISFKGFPIYSTVGSTLKGPVLLYGPRSQEIYNEHIMENLTFLPENFENSSEVDNPGVVILTEK
ncbi:MAG: hypothetical protein COC06_09910 [Bacteroidales bacterium]|nr:MAG: hypothetical protein COC06_09910 [Bacteroidales bacterium]